MSQTPSAEDMRAFLECHFAGLDPAELERVLAGIEVERFPAGAAIGGAARLVRSGAVELVVGDRVLDRLAEGELFGHPAMLSALPDACEVRAAEDAVCWRLGADAPLLGGTRARPLSLRREPAAEALDPVDERVLRLVGERPPLCGPELTVGDAARRMVERAASCVLVRDGDGPLGIVTDRDLRARVLAAGLPGDTPVGRVMTRPALTVAPDGSGAEALLTMLDHGIRHLPVVAPRGEVVGVLRDIDLLAARARTPFVLRRAIADARHARELGSVARRLPETVVALHDARMAPAQVSAVLSVVTDALTRRLLELALARRGAPPARLAWIALGSHGRREAVPSSDLDSAIVWEGDDPALAEPIRGLAAEVVDDLGTLGLRADPHGATASAPLFAHSVAGWHALIDDLVADPGRPNAPIYLSMLCDARVVSGGDWVGELFERLGHARERPPLLRLMLRLALAVRPPTGFLRDIVVEHSGEHRGHFDIKHGGLLPIVNLARYGSLAAGAPATSTLDRLEACAAAGTLPDAAAATLAEAFELVSALRFEHQVAALREGRPADDFVDPHALNPLARRYLRETFRAVTQLQRTLANQLELDALGG